MFGASRFYRLLANTKSLFGRARQVGVVVLTSGHILGGIAVEGEVVEDGAFGASGNAGVFALHADVEAAAIVGLDVTGVVEDVSISVDLGRVGAGEAIIQNLDSEAASAPDAGVLPLAGTGELVEHETGGAGPQDGEAVGALVVLVAVGGVLVFEVTVQTWALNAGGLGRLQCGALRAGYDEGVVALFDAGTNWGIEDKTIRAEFLSLFASVAIEVLVALDGIPEETVIDTAVKLPADERSTSNEDGKG